MTASPAPASATATDPLGDRDTVRAVNRRAAIILPAAALATATAWTAIVALIDRASRVHWAQVVHALSITLSHRLAVATDATMPTVAVALGTVLAVAVIVANRRTR